MATRQTLKHDHFGTIALHSDDAGPRILRDTSQARWGLGWIARRMARREAAALARLHALDGIPRLIAFDGTTLARGYLPATVMYAAQPVSRDYFRAALRLLIRMHRRGVAHNDLAKEANWLSFADGAPGIVDFQIASICVRRGRVFRVLAREDLRHLLKHKEHYLPGEITARQRAILRSPSAPARVWRTIVKPVYRIITRRLLGWAERDGAVERQHPRAESER